MSHKDGLLVQDVLTPRRLVLYLGLIVWKTNGFVPGKRLFHIRVVSLVHDRITRWQAIERALGYGAPILEPGRAFYSTSFIRTAAASTAASQRRS